MNKTYTISPYAFLFNDAEQTEKAKRIAQLRNLHNHVNVGDYFGTLATIVDLMLQDSEEKNKTLKKIKADLVHLQENYRISKKN